MIETEYKPQDYPLPYVIPDIKDWPIYRLSEDKENFLNEVKERTRQHLKLTFDTDKKLREELSRVLYQEKIRLTEKAWKADPKDEHKFWNGIKSKLIKVDSVVEKSPITEDEILNLILDRYTHEIVGQFDINAFGLAKAILPQFFGRILSAAPGKWFKTLAGNVKTIHEKIPISGDIDKIRHLATKGTVVVVPTHFSNMDSIMVGWILNELGLPAFTYGAGLNLFSIQLLSYFMNRLGAYKLDRRKKNSVYMETLKTYSTVALQRGAHSIFFPGGTRSRSGTLEKKLKLGLLGTTIEAQKLNFKNYNDDVAPKIFIVPCVINYHFVLEAQGLINDHLRETGKEKFIRENDEYSTSFKLVRFMLKFFTASSSLAVSFGDVMDVLGNKVDADGNSYNHLKQPINVRNYFITNGELKDDAQRDEEYTKILGQRIVENYYRYNVVLTSHLTCFVTFEIIKKTYRTHDLFALLRIAPEDIVVDYAQLIAGINLLKEKLKEMYARGEILMSHEMRWPAEKIIEHGMRNINLYHSSSPLLKTSDTTVGTEDLKLLYYYHNRLDGYGLEKYFR